MNGLTTEVRQLFQTAMKLDLPPATVKASDTHDRTLRALDTASNICPYLKSVESVDMDELRNMAQCCPFMMEAGLITDDQDIDFEELGKKLLNPLNFMNFSKVAEASNQSSSIFDKHFEKSLERIKEENRYRVFINIIRAAGNFPKA
jgi:hypothetical protein